MTTTERVLLYNTGNINTLFKPGIYPKLLELAPKNHYGVL